MTDVYITYLLDTEQNREEVNKRKLMEEMDHLDSTKKRKSSSESRERNRRDSAKNDLYSRLKAQKSGQRVAVSSRFLELRGHQPGR